MNKRLFAKYVLSSGALSFMYLMVLILLLNLLCSCSGDPKIPLLYYQGDVKLRKAGESDWKQIKSSINLVRGDKIKTGEKSLAIIVISSDASIRMAEKSQISIFNLDRSSDDSYIFSLALAKGTIWISQKATSNFENKMIAVVTEDNVFAEPKGAEFDITYKDFSTSVRVFKGEVSFYHGLYTDHKVTVKEGSCSSIKVQQPPPPPVEMVPEMTGLWEKWNLNLPLSGNLLRIKSSELNISPPSDYKPEKIEP